MKRGRDKGEYENEARLVVGGATIKNVPFAVEGRRIEKYALGLGEWGWSEFFSLRKVFLDPSIVGSAGRTRQGQPTKQC